MATTRERMIVSTALLMRERGARATSIDDVLTHSGAPRGSVYHHFPGGREQIIREAIDFAGDFIADRIERAGGAVEMLDELVGYYREELVTSDFRAGCPVLAAAVEAGDPDSDVGEYAGAVFSRWQGMIERQLVSQGVKRARAAELAMLVLAAGEGAIVMARVRRDPAPLDKVHQQMRALLRAAIKEAGSR